MVKKGQLWEHTLTKEVVEISNVLPEIDVILISSKRKLYTQYNRIPTSTLTAWYKHLKHCETKLWKVLNEN